MNSYIPSTDSKGLASIWRVSSSASTQVSDHNAKWQLCCCGSTVLPMFRPASNQAKKMAYLYKYSGIHQNMLISPGTFNM